MNTSPFSFASMNNGSWRRKKSKDKVSYSVFASPKKYEAREYFYPVTTFEENRVLITLQFVYNLTY